MSIEQNIRNSLVNQSNLLIGKSIELSKRIEVTGTTIEDTNEPMRKSGGNRQARKKSPPHRARIKRENRVESILQQNEMEDLFGLSDDSEG